MALFSGKWLTRYHVDYGVADQKYYQDSPSIVYSNEFLITKIKPTRLRICSLGYYVVKINGRLISNDVLNNEWTYFSKCKYYDEYNVTDLIHIGENDIEVELGNGMYNPFPLKFFAKHNLREGIKDTGEPRFILELFDDDHTILNTDKNWKAETGSRTFNNLYMGEYVDVKCKGKSVNFKAVPLSRQDDLAFRKSFIPKVREFNPLEIQQIIKDKNEHFILDFGQTISGFFKIDVLTDIEKNVRFRFCETVRSNHLDYATSFAGGIGCIEGVTGGPGAPERVYEEDRWHIYPGKNKFKNCFSYHSFRYVEIWGITKDEIKIAQAIPAHTDLAQIGEIKSGDAFLDELYQVGINTRLNNVHGIFEDCARERLQYGGDIVALLDSMMLTWDLSQFNKKVINDFILGQTNEGGIPETAPYVGIGSQSTAHAEGPLLWQLVLPYLLVKYYQYYGDYDFLNSKFNYIKKQYNYLMSWNLKALAQRCIGDHGSPSIGGFYESTPDKIFVGYCTILLFNELYLKINRILNKTTSEIKKKNKEIRAEIRENYLNKDGSFGQKTQTSYAFALALNLGNRKQLITGLIRRFKQDKGLFTAGIFGQSLLYTQLHLIKRDDIVYSWLENSSSTGFKAMLSDGNLALKEKLRSNESSDSANHAMFSSYLKWYYQALGGISLADDAVASDKIIVAPYLSSQLNNVKMSFNTVKGLIRTKTKIEDNKFQYIISLPQSIKYELSSQLKQGQINLKHNRRHLIIDIQGNLK